MLALFSFFLHFTWIKEFPFKSVPLNDFFMFLFNANDLALKEHFKLIVIDVKATLEQTCTFLWQYVHENDKSKDI